MVNREETYTKTLEIGSRIHCILYGGRDGVIYKIRGLQSPETVRSLGGGCIVMGGSASFDIVWEDGTESRGTPESLVRTSVQWRVLEGKASGPEILAMRGAAILETNRKADEAKERAEAKAKAIAELRSSPEFSYLKQTDGENGGGAAFAAANLRTQLKRTFPGVKFSVRSSVYSGGDSISVRWTDGPTSKEVEALADRYEAGSFDGMEDLYTYCSTAWTVVFGDAKFVQCSRSHSLEAMKEAIREVCLEYGWELLKVNGSDGNTWLDCDHDKSRIIYNFLEKREY